MDGIKFLVKTPITISKTPSIITNQASDLVPLINGERNTSVLFTCTRKGSVF